MGEGAAGCHDICTVAKGRTVVSIPCWEILDRNPFYFIQRNLVAGTVIELGRARAFMRGHGLGIFQRSTGLEIGGNASCPEDVAAELLFEPGLGGTAADHPIGIDAMHRL